MHNQFSTTQKFALYQRFMLASGNFFFRFRNALFPIVIGAVILLTRPSLFLGSTTIDRVAMGLGLAMTLAGQCFRLLVIGFVYIKRGGKDGQIYAENLVTRGFYAHTRNPMYVGNFLIAAGMVLMYGVFEVFLFVVLFFAFVYLSIVIAEEKFLLEHFGEQYESYSQKVNRFVPDLRGIRESLRDYRYDWKRALRKDYGTLYLTLVGICSLHIWKAYNLYGFHERKQLIFILAILIGSFTVLCAFVRHIKSKKILR